MSRRSFLTTSTVAAAAFAVVPRHVLGGPGYVAPSDRLNIACVGVQGKGHSDINSVSPGNNIVALCDVDEDRIAQLFKRAKEDDMEWYEQLKKAKIYTDWRTMLKHEKDIDAVTVSTPDHSHAPVAIHAMKLGKHCFVQKPLTHTIYEARKMAQVAKEMKVKTQMGNQGHSKEGARLINEWIWDGAIGDVHEVYCWTNRPIWPQNIEKPKEVPSLPPSLNWNVWLGAAPWRTYHPAYHPFAWRGWMDFGTGALGDMGAHIFDHPYWALKLKDAATVQASCSEYNDQTYPMSSMVTYTFDARENMPACKLTWLDGGLQAPRPEELEPGRKLGDGGGGMLFIGSKGKLMAGTYGDSPRIIPETKMKEYKLPAKTIPRSPGIHEEWVEAIKENKETTSNFEYAGRLTETMLLGNIAVRMNKSNQILQWDGPNLRFTNSEEATAMVTKEYRKGFELEG
ncbi:MAG: Gfo/Idh/MocA family oxidoreductase [Deferribacteres bacterium]|nr:Gfo/Idh/MocA family oxidoreductase [candidate division KSB1 bacterium]MCB9501149.1 Gfo/Idh/MocA family oxidoreductase [Deferribacteres bacterium]